MTVLHHLKPIVVAAHFHEQNREERSNMDRLDAAAAVDSPHMKSKSSVWIVLVVVMALAGKMNPASGIVPGRIEGNQ